ncbi:MAG: bifunctional demethylmenaquinone methyltransferase/2-methoxy-6-polyprenyl-1,4-benzoquinol methylase UbiE [Bacteroidota bacterium]
MSTSPSPTFAAPMNRTYAHDQIVPDEGSKKGKKAQVAAMFDSIAHRYYFLNRFLSGGIDIYWRKKALETLKPLQPKQILDVATGTGDLAIMAAEILKPATIIGIDISPNMLEAGRKKIEHKSLNTIITLVDGDSEAINFPENSFDAVMVAFGVRNFENLEKGLSEILRVLKPEGQLVVLEFSKPSIPLWSHLYRVYMKYIAPKLAGWLSRNKKAYIYLHDSIQAFPEGRQFVEVMNKTGFKQVTCKSLTFGISSIYTGRK